jgi:hypothetical protein
MFRENYVLQGGSQSNEKGLVELLGQENVDLRGPAGVRNCGQRFSLKATFVGRQKRVSGHNSQQNSGLRVFAHNRLGCNTGVELVEKYNTNTRSDGLNSRCNSDSYIR